MEADDTRYSDVRGLPELRVALAEYLTQLHARPVAEERVQITASGMTAVSIALAATVRAGDRVVLHSPAWPNVGNAARLRGAQVDELALTPLPGGGFRVDYDRLDRMLQGARAFILNTPNNPTGWTATRDELLDILNIARRRGVWLIADEVYARIVYGNRAAPSFLEQSEPEDRLIVANSFSKAWAMTGWRLGWLTLPPSVLPEIEKLVEFNTSGSPTFLQRAAIVAIRDGEDFVESFAARCRAGRDIAIEGLQACRRVSVARPDGAFYAFLRVEGLTDSVAFAKELLHTAKVGLAPGSAFGPMGEGWLRMCFARDTATVAEAVERLRAVLD